MELIKCKDCNKEISKSAPTCPNCGAKQKKPASMGCVVLIIITVLAIGYVASMDVSSGGGEKNPINAEQPIWGQTTYMGSVQEFIIY
jgi:RNA polymerase subunit RPABC4/transcription elongation factor Spt4